MSRDRGEFVYALPTAIQGERIVLSEEEAHHLYRVRRVGVGEAIHATTGDGVVYQCAVNPDHTLKIERRLADFGEPAMRITLGMAILKGDLNRDLVDLATQLGVRSIQFFQAERSEGRLMPEKLERLRRTAITAIKQCGRAWLPELDILPSMPVLLSRLNTNTPLYIAQPTAKREQGTYHGLAGQNVTLLVGPEGGFTENELTAASQAGAIALHLGDRRLRAETAAAAGLSYLLTRDGDFRAPE